MRIPVGTAFHLWLLGQKLNALDTLLCARFSSQQLIYTYKCIYIYIYILSLDSSLAPNTMLKIQDLS